jgi:hypothetical protein
MPNQNGARQFLNTESSRRVEPVEENAPPVEVGNSTGVGVQPIVEPLSSRFRSLYPFILVSSANCIGATIVVGFALKRYQKIIMPENPSNETLAYVSQYNQQQNETQNQLYQNIMIPMAIVSFGALGIKQALSCLRRRNSNSDRIIEMTDQGPEQEPGVSAEILYNVSNRDQASDENGARARASQGLERPDTVPSLSGSGIAELNNNSRQVSPTRYLV